MVVIAGEMIPTIEFFILIFQVTSIFIYLLICCYLVHQIHNPNNHFQPSFIIHFTCNAFFDTLSSFSILLFRKLTYWGYFYEYFAQNEWGAEAYKYLFFQTITLTISGNIIISVNRFLALYNPINYTRVWNIKVSFLIVFLQVVICYASYIHIFFTDTAFLYDSHTNTYQFTTPNKYFSLANNGVLLSFCVIGIIITTSLNILVFIKFSKIFKKNDKGKYGSKVTMLAFMILASFFLVITAIQLIIRSIAISTNNKPLKDVINNYFFYSIPILSTLQPYLILLLSAQLRNGIKKFVCLIAHGKKVSHIKVTVFNKEDGRTSRK
uniref:G_PROTEIN_RECEP_F1_2 domain-containing protein n=1 Tax=Parastrongyloides trichosuri TaxID=131310 RepID=A0A0N5A6C5_PARTI